MLPSRWRQIESIYNAARERVPEERADYLDQACAGDAEICREVEALLAQDKPKAAIPDHQASEEGEGLSATAATVTVIGPGVQIGPYRIEGQIGKGGMGEVFRAIDTRLGRAVAIKASQEHFSERFEREVRAISAVNHPHICTLYDVGAASSGTSYLVMELVDGETLASRLKRGALAIDQVLRYGAQIADALAAAHAKGITHRDLKPSNIMLSKTAGVKVLDFGLAKMRSAPGEVLTTSNVIMGTPAYMAPEQLQGEEADARSDIYSLGSVLYEMATGKRGMRGTMHPLDHLPEQLAHVTERCLAEDPDARWQTAAEIRALLELRPKAMSKASTRWKWPAAVAVVVVALVGGAAWLALRPKPEQPMFQMQINPPEGIKFVPTITPFALSPDGKKLVVLVVNKNGKRMLWLRSTDAESATEIAGTENAEVPFWSPDSQWVGFAANGKLQKVNIASGSSPQIICDIRTRAGGTWNKDDVIVFDQGDRALLQVPTAGGTPAPILQLDSARQEIFHGAPFFLPDGHHLLYFSSGKQGVAIKVASLDGKLNRVLVPGAGAVSYAPNPDGGGSILYSLRGQLIARPFDPDKLEFTGPPVVLADAVGDLRWWSSSVNGLLAFRHNYGTQYEFKWFGRDGKTVGTVGSPGMLNGPRVSPDQKTVAFTRFDGQNSDVWTFDLARDSAARFTFEGLDFAPVWSPDGKELIYASGATEAPSLKRKPSGGVGGEVLITGPTGNGLLPTGVSRDARWLLYTEAGSLHSVISVRSLEDTNKVIHLQEQGQERDGTISRDGRWLLYSSVPAGRREVFVESVPKEISGAPAPTGKWQISTAGGSQPAWRADGKEIFYVAPDNMMMTVSIESGVDSFRPAAPRALFQTHLDFNAVNNGVQYDVTPDGQRFLLNQHVADVTEAPITVVVNWPKLLESHIRGFGF